MITYSKYTAFYAKKCNQYRELRLQQKIHIFFLFKKRNSYILRGGLELVPAQSHTLYHAGSNPAPAT